MFGRTPGAGASARPNGGVQTAHAAPLRIAFSWSSAIYAFLPVVADGPSRARCDDEPPACAGLAMAVLAAPWVRPGEGRFSSLLRPRFKSHRDQPKHPPRPGRPRGVPCGVSRARPRKLRAPAGVGSGSSQRVRNGKGNKNKKKERQVRGARERTALGLHPHAARALGARSRRVHCGVRGPGRPLRCRLAASFRPSHHAHCSLAPPRTGEGSHHERQTRTRTRREARRADTPRATTRVT